MRVVAAKATKNAFDNATVRVNTLEARTMVLGIALCCLNLYVLISPLSVCIVFSFMSDYALKLSYNHFNA